nr:uncharacterized protein LOC113729046 [Coffea arabica]
MNRRGHERGRGHGIRQSCTPETGEESETGPNQNPRNEEGDQVVTVINRMTDILERLAERQGLEPVDQPRNQERCEDKALERFLKFAPPKFHGGSNPEIAETWFERMVDIFAALDYTDERQVNFAVFQFERAARSWWNIVSTKWEREQIPWTWINFEREFNVKFLPPIIQEKREDDFIKLKLGLLSVAEYEEQFTKLFKFAPELVLTERKRIKKFIQGLNVEIQESLAAAQITTFTDVLDKAQRVENAKSQSRTFHARKRGNPNDIPKPSEKSTQPLNMEKGIGGVKVLEKSGETPSSKAPPKGN